MIESIKRKSVFKIIFFRIIIAVLLFNTVFTLINIKDTITLKKDSDELLRTKIREEFIGITEFQQSALQNLEGSFLELQEDALRKLVKTAEKVDLRTDDLKKRLKFLGLDTLMHDIYIIEDNVVVNTTYMADYMLDFSVFGEEHVKKLNDILEKGTFFPERFVFESSTKKMRSYSYQATKDRKYIIEIGSYSEMADKFMEMFKLRLKQTALNHDNIVSVNYWFGDSDYQFPLIDEALNRYIPDSIKTNAFIHNSDYATEINARGKELYLEMMHIEPDPSSSIPEFVLSIITDISDKNKPITKIITRQASLTVVFLILLVGIIFIATRPLLKILKDLLSKISEIANGALEKRVDPIGNNEFTTLAEHFNDMVGKLETSYKELNDINNLITEKNVQLETQNEEISAQRDEIEAQRDLVLSQKDQIEKINEDLTDSIRYAKNIQSAILPRSEEMYELVPDHFVLFRPRDIVSGDFYWLTEVEKKIIIVVADCTGHGVPGAFMSMLGAAFLNEIVTKEYITHPGVVMRKLRKEVIHAMQQKGESGEHRDGMDAVLCTIDFETKQMQFAGANNPIYIIREKNLEEIPEARLIEGESVNLYEIKGDKMPIAYHERMDKFVTHDIQLFEGDCVYMFSDGFADQFGGPDGKKFKYKPFKEMLLKNSYKDMHEQKELFDKLFQDWKLDYNQVDDIILFGFRV